MKIMTIACTPGYQLPREFGVPAARVRHIDVPVSAAGLGWGANRVVRSADVIAVKPTFVEQASVPLSRLRVRTLT